MLKRIYFGGFGKLCYVQISFILCIIGLIQNIVFVIMDFIFILLTIFFYISFKKNEYTTNSNDYINEKYYLQIILNIIIFIYNIKLFKENIGLIKDYNKIRKEVIKFNKNEDNIDESNINFKPTEFKYISPEGNVFTLKEYRNPNLQRYLFYYPENVQKNQLMNKIPLDKKEIKENEIKEIIVSNGKINNIDKITDIYNPESEKGLK